MASRVQALAAPTVVLRRARARFGAVVKRELQALLDQGLGRRRAVHALFRRITAPGATMPPRAVVDDCMRQLGLCREDAIRALLVRDQINAMVEQGLTVIEAFHALTVRMQTAQDKPIKHASATPLSRKRPAPPRQPDDGTTDGGGTNPPAPSTRDGASSSPPLQTPAKRMRTHGPEHDGAASSSNTSAAAAASKPHSSRSVAPTTAPPSTAAVATVAGTAASQSPSNVGTASASCVPDSAVPTASAAAPVAADVRGDHGATSSPQAKSRLATLPSPAPATRSKRPLLQQLEEDTEPRRRKRSRR